MQAVAHNPDLAKKTGIPQSAGKEYAQATHNPKDLPNKLAKALRK